MCDCFVHDVIDSSLCPEIFTRWLPQLSQKRLVAGSANLSKFVAHPLATKFSSFRFSAKRQLANRRRGPHKVRHHSMTRKSMRYNLPCSNQKGKWQLFNHCAYQQSTSASRKLSVLAKAVAAANRSRALR